MYQRPTCKGHDTIPKLRFKLYPTLKITLTIPVSPQTGGKAGTVWSYSFRIIITQTREVVIIISMTTSSSNSNEEVCCG